MALPAILRRLGLAIERFNRWLAPAAIADGTLQGPTPQHADPGHVVAILGELEKRPREGERGDSPST